MSQQPFVLCSNLFKERTENYLSLIDVHNFKFTETLSTAHFIFYLCYHCSIIMWTWLLHLSSDICLRWHHLYLLSYRPNPVNYITNDPNVSKEILISWLFTLYYIIL